MDSNGYMKRGWLWNGGHWYYLASDGAMKTGWLTDGKAKYYLNADGSMKTGWLKTGGKWYFLNSSGAMKTGWLWNGGYWYYLASDGAMKTGWFWDGKNWYYFNKAGDMRYGWLEENGAKYYLGSSGAMLTGSQKISGTWYYFNGDGSLAVSTNSYSNTEEFIQCIAPLVIKYAPQYNVKVYSPIIAQAILESASGESSLGKQYNNFFGLKCGTLWTGKSVNLRTGEEYTPGSYTTISANFRVYDTMEEGVRGYFEFLFRNRTRYNNLIGETDPYEYLVKIKADEYATSSNYVRNVYNVIKSYNLMLAAAAPMLSPAFPVRAAARVSSAETSPVRADLSAGKFAVENGRTYCKNADGSNRTGWVSESGSWYYFDQKDGHMLTGWVKDGGKWYYLNTKDGKMVTGWLVLNPSGTKYYLKKDGSMIQGPAWATIGSGRYFFTSDGDVANAWELKEGKWYYYTTEGTAVKNRWILYKNHYYYMSADGTAAVGTVKIDGREYKFGSSCDLLGAVPSSVAAAAKAPLTTEKLKSGTANVKTEKDSAATAKNADKDAQKETAAAKEEAWSTAPSSPRRSTRAAGENLLSPLNTTTTSDSSAVPSGPERV